jgi:hypothetical protein
MNVSNFSPTTLFDMSASVFDRWVSIADIALGESDADAPFATYDDLIRLQKEARVLTRRLKNQTAKAESMKREVLDNRELLKIRATNLRTIIQKLLDIPSQSQAIQDVSPVIQTNAESDSSADSESSSEKEKEVILEKKTPQKGATVPATSQDVPIGAVTPQGAAQIPSPQSGKPSADSPDDASVSSASEHNGLTNASLLMP